MGRRGWRIVLGLIVIGAGLALWIISMDEGVSRDEDNWRNRSSRWFQDDFPPGHARGILKKSLDKAI